MSPAWLQYLRYLLVNGTAAQRDGALRVLVQAGVFVQVTREKSTSHTSP